jgi:hypothetical protein
MDIKKEEFENLYYRLTNKQLAAVYNCCEKTIAVIAKQLSLSKKRGPKNKLKIINE